MDDFDLVALAQRIAVVLAAWHDFVVHLHGDAPSGVAGFVEESSHGEVVSAVVRMAIQADLHPIIVAGAPRFISVFCETSLHFYVRPFTLGRVIESLRYLQPAMTIVSIRSAKYAGGEYGRVQAFARLHRQSRRSAEL